MWIPTSTGRRDCGGICPWQAPEKYPAGGDCREQEGHTSRYGNARGIDVADSKKEECHEHARQ